MYVDWTQDAELAGDLQKVSIPNWPSVLTKGMLPDWRTVTRRVPGGEEGGEEEEELAEAGGRGSGEVEEDAKAVGRRHWRRGEG